VVSLEQAKNIQDALNNLINRPEFNNSNFLKQIHKKIKEISDEFDQVVESVYLKAVDVPAHLQQEQHPDSQLVYVSVYSSDGNNPSSWERVLTNLPKQYINRPIYTNEKAVQTAIKAKSNLDNEGYVAVFVDKKDIINTNEKDKFGYELISLKDKALNLDKVKFFWHKSSQYALQEQKLKFVHTVADFTD